MKLSEMREKSVDELQSAIVDWKKQLLESRLQLSTQKLENTASISKTKKLIAQAQTIITEKIMYPKMEGAIVIAKGAQNTIVKENITHAVEAATGLAVHKIQVFEMK